MWSFVVDSAKCVQLLQMLESWTQNGKERGQCSNNVWGSTKIWRYLMQTRDKLYVQLPNSELFTCLNVTKASDYEKLEVHLLQVAWQKIEKKKTTLSHPKSSSHVTTSNHERLSNQIVRGPILMPRLAQTVARHLDLEPLELSCYTNTNTEPEEYFACHLWWEHVELEPLNSGPYIPVECAIHEQWYSI